MSNLGELNYFLGMEINKSKTKIFLSQRIYVLEIEKKFKLDLCKLVETPVTANRNFSMQVEAKLVVAIANQVIYG